MKKLVFLFLFVSGLSLNAQHDLKLNVSNLLLYEVNLNYEYVANEFISIGGMGSYIYGFPGQEENTSMFYLGPEFRYYFSPKNGADRFFMGIYSRFLTGQSPVDVEYYDTTNFFYTYSTTSQDVQFLTVGLTIGGKWVVGEGVVFEIFGSLGRHMYTKFDDPDLSLGEDFGEVYGIGLINEYFDTRFGFNLGYRFDAGPSSRNGRRR